MLKTGSEHIETLRDGRQVFINGKLADDVTVHPAFRQSIQSVARLYDFQSAEQNRAIMTYEVNGAGAASRIWQMPDNYAELVARRRALETWATLHCGFLGRAPDHVASCLAGMIMGIEIFQTYDPKRAEALAEYYRYARDNDLYLTYVIINPQADRSKSASQQQDRTLTAGIVDQDAEGLTIRGAKMLATGGIMANEVFVTCIQPLSEGDESYAVSFAIPMNARGLKIMSRKSYEEQATSVFDNPLASRFDENDAILYFDDVKVPWDRVFINQDIRMCQQQFHATPAHVLQNYQAQIRLMVKMRFLLGLAHRIAETNGIVSFPQVRETLGVLAAQNTMVDALVHAMEVKGRNFGAYFVPDAHTLYSAQVLTQKLYPEVISSLRELAGGGLIMLPSSVEDFADPQLKALIEKTQQSPSASAEGRVKLFKLAWDAIGSEFASRHTQYEMFYAGANFVTRTHSYRTCDWHSGTRLVDQMLDSYSLEGDLAAQTAVAA
ncbi:4-hydroxyphenylacetate 3-hydroxylase family protein [Rhizobium indigoferae]|uniref:4-hydroxyphenylacetate 3-hydroxylase N-terminal domain-containing protein n=1 Tax=Rhizobium indigoferae TaxID=158891 RepID=A0ABZ0ZAQ1_9HYPH|nr:4-hydroxyphenylacetate 3-hydroxylase N-terminal domain-containing protein [Rhizobium indigoferae]NNU57372.1 4-hydroxyphenylacetate 3-monooxygenase [Rhizobium indigoferae]WQN35712.1 4-hydroxyphenylacetate 3-hydroxylase N-terminal domain-containing protein [Rhizobium indigoferae]GLR60460.1 pyoverdin chromophore biosynthetic protein PvcC [Rhizobium indigoferae]